MKLTVLGAGSRTPLLLRGLAQRAGTLPVREVVLHDADPARLALMAWLGSRLCESWGAGITVRPADDARDAIAGARFVLAAIRVGGDDGRVLDERLALEHGVIGQETTGPGGFAMALRTIPPMLEHAWLVEELAPGALLINFTNPAGLVTQAIRDHSAVPAVGICDTPVAAKRSLARFLGLPDDEVRLDYLGLNHLGWIRGVHAEGSDHLPELLHRYEELAASDLMWRLFDPELVRGLGMLPNEYLHYYYARRDVLARLQGAPVTRGEQVRELNRSLWAHLGRAAAADDLDDALSAHEETIRTREATYLSGELGVEPPTPIAADGPGFEGAGYEGLATAVMVAALGNHRAPLILNVPAAGAVEWADPHDVLELPCVFEDGVPVPVAQPALPPAAAALAGPVKAFERLTIEAAVSGSRRAAVTALASHPLVGDHATAASLVTAYLRAHERHLAAFRRAPAEVGR